MFSSTSGALGEGKQAVGTDGAITDHELTLFLDGIHVDMNHLKKGEVK